MLEAVALTCLRGDRVLFRELSFCVEPKSLLWVTGANGSGKTSLLRLLCGLSRPDSGGVTWNGREIRTEREEYQHELLYLGHLNGLKDDLTPEENLWFDLANRGEESDKRMVVQFLIERGLKSCMELPLRVLSQGQKRRVALTRLAANRMRKLWILDEPFAALDGAAIEDLTKLLGTYVSEGGAVVLTSHQEVALRDAYVRRLELAR
jgi:heme exporter protein A